MLDRDLAELYGVLTGNLNKAVKRNIRRFPNDFMFQLSKEEFENLIFTNCEHQVGVCKKFVFVSLAIQNPNLFLAFLLMNIATDYND